MDLCHAPAVWTVVCFIERLLSAQLNERKKCDSLQVGRKEIASLLGSCDVDEKDQKAFDKGYLEQFGAVGRKLRVEKSTFTDF